MEVMYRETVMYVERMLCIRIRGEHARVQSVFQQIKSFTINVFSITESRYLPN